MIITFKSRVGWSVFPRFLECVLYLSMISFILSKERQYQYHMKLQLINKKEMTKNNSDTVMFRIIQGQTMTLTIATLTVHCNNDRGITRNH